MWIELWAICSQGNTLGASYYKQGKKNVQPDRDLNRDPQSTLTWLNRLSYSATYTFSPLNSEQL
jgi:hypothetical protein